MGLAQDQTMPPGEDLTYEIVTTVADVRGVDPMNLEERLFEVVDPDALWQLSANRPDGTSRRGGQVTFTLAGCEVTVDGERQVTVASPNDSALD